MLFFLQLCLEMHTQLILYLRLTPAKIHAKQNKKGSQFSLSLYIKKTKKKQNVLWCLSTLPYQSSACQ